LKFQLEEQRNERQAQLDMMLEKMRLQSEQNNQLLLAHLNNATKIETARISAGIDDGTQFLETGV
jgi:hypothetical protein